MGSDKPMTQTEFYADYYHKKIEEIYEQVFEYISEHRIEAVEALQRLAYLDNEEGVDLIIYSALLKAGGAASLEDFKDEVLRPLWKYDSVEVAWEAYQAKHNLVTSGDDN